MVMTVACEASTSRPAELRPHARASSRLCRAWRQPARLFRQPFAGAVRARRRAQQMGAPRAAAAEAAEAANSELVPSEEAGKPAQRRPGYRSFPMDTCEFLVAEAPDGALDLSDIYVLDSESDVYARPDVSGELPAGPRQYQALEVGAEYLGNVLEEKLPKHWVYRVYLIPIKSPEPDYELDLSQVYLLDDKTRCASRQPVVWLAPEDTAKHDLRLRVRNGIITVESIESLPNWEEVVLAHESGLSALSEVELSMLDRAAAGELAWEEVQAIVGEEYVRMWQEEPGGQGDAGPEEVPADDLLLSTGLEDNLDENLKDFVEEYDDEAEDEFDDFDSPAVDY